MCRTPHHNILAKFLLRKSKKFYRFGFLKIHKLNIMKKNYILALLVFTGFTFAQSTDPAPYCLATFDNGVFDIDNAINQVQIGSLNNISGGRYAYPHYVFYNNLPTVELERGQSHEMTLKFDVFGGAGYGVWIDFNQDGIFVPQERVLGTLTESLEFGENISLTQSFTIPANALLGDTRMRIRIAEDDNFSQGTNFNTPPCNEGETSLGILDWGETEDYTVKITGVLGVNDASKSTFSVYPNPVNSVLNINTATSEIMSYKIFNLQGAQIMSGDVNSSNNQISVDAISQGIYFIKMTAADNTSSTLKFIKK